MSGLTIGSLFAGIGGFDLAAEFYGWRTSWFVEWDASCRYWLAEHFPGRPIYGDITQVDFSDVEAVDVLCGGFPCQPSSAAGKRLGTADDRWLWPHFARAVREIRPRYVVAENVLGLLSVNGGRAFAEVLRDLAALGYDAEWDCLAAGAVGSPQERERVWIVAYRDGGRLGERAQLDGATLEDSADRDSRRRHTHGRSGQVGHAGSERLQRLPCDEARRELARPTETRRAWVGDPDGGRCEQRHAGFGECGEPCARLVPLGDARCARREERLAPSLAGHTRHLAGERRRVGDWSDAVPVRGVDGTVRLIPREAAEEGPESPLWPVADGLPGRVARLRAAGNAVVPQCVIEGPFRVIAELEAMKESAA